MSTYHVSVPEVDAIWESHTRYGDLQIMIAEKEQIGVSHADTPKVTVRKGTDDFISYSGPVANWYPMESQDVLIVFPVDAHMVKVLLDKPMEVSRAVLKFKLVIYKRGFNSLRLYITKLEFQFFKEM